jgi:hypothetical protein
MTSPWPLSTPTTVPRWAVVRIEDYGWKESNEPVEKVTFLKTAPSAESKIGIYFLSSKVFTILGAMFVFS